MASEVDVCNLALSHLGDTASVTSISPPDQSAQAAHCARFYPVARDALLEMHQWGFATVRATLAQLAINPASSWQYAYGVPSDVINYIAVLDPQVQDDYSVGVPMGAVGPYAQPVVGLGVYTPQPFEIESDLDSGNAILYCNVQNAVLRYTRAVADTTKFPPLFVRCLSHYLASMLAGALIKGETGQQVADTQLKIAMQIQAQAEGSDANQRNVKPAAGAPWMVNR